MQRAQQHACLAAAPDSRGGPTWTATVIRSNALPWHSLREMSPPNPAVGDAAASLPEPSRTLQAERRPPLRERGNERHGTCCGPWKDTEARMRRKIGIG